MSISPLLLLFPAAMAFAAAMDLVTFTIPNKVSIALVAAFVLTAPLVGLSPLDILWHASAGTGALAAGIAMFARGWIGGGDAKLMAATALWLGFEDLTAYLLMTAMLGGVLAILILAYRSVALPWWLVGQDWAVRLHHADEGIPYGIALAGAALWIYPSSKWFAALGI